MRCDFVLKPPKRSKLCQPGRSHCQGEGARRIKAVHHISRRGTVPRADLRYPSASHAPRSGCRTGRYEWRSGILISNPSVTRTSQSQTTLSSARRRSRATAPSRHARPALSIPSEKGCSDRFATCNTNCPPTSCGLARTTHQCQNSPRGSYHRNRSFIPNR
jgi:hypothetical protein